MVAAHPRGSNQHGRLCGVPQHMLTFVDEANTQTTASTHPGESVAGMPGVRCQQISNWLKFQTNDMQTLDNTDDYAGSAMLEAPSTKLADQAYVVTVRALLPRGQGNLCSGQ